MNHTLARFYLVLFLLLPFENCAFAKPADDTELQIFKAQIDAKFEAAKDGQQKDLQIHQQLVTSQNERIEQINHQVDWLGSLIALGSLIITLMLVVIGYFAYGKAKSDAEGIAKTVARDEAHTTSEAEVKQWFSDNLKLVNSEINTLRETLKQLEEEVNSHAEQAHQSIEADKARVSKITENTLLSNDTNSELTATEQQTLAAANITLQNKPESQYTFQDWNIRAFAAHEQSSFALAAEYWKNAAHATKASDEQISQALYNQAISLRKNNSSRVESDACYQQLLQRFDHSQQPALKRRVAMALNGLGFSKILDAKLAWDDQPTRTKFLTDGLSYLERATEKNPSDITKAMILGNMSYALWLLGKEERVEAPLHEALMIGGKEVFDGEIADTKISPVPPDSGFAQLVTRLWNELSSKLRQ